MEETFVEKIKLVTSLAQDQSAIPRTDNPAVFDERLPYGGFEDADLVRRVVSAPSNDFHRSRLFVQAKCPIREQKSPTSAEQEA
jgi:hypothetical protein